MIEAFRKCGLFEGLSDEDVAPLSAICHAQTLKAGEILFSEGEPGDAIWLVSSGIMMLNRKVAADGIDVNMPLVELGPENILGVQVFIRGHAHMATAAAKEDCELICLPVDEAGRALQGLSPDVLNKFYQNVIRLLTKRALTLMKGQADLYAQGLKERNEATKKLEISNKKLLATQKLIKKMLEESQTNREEVEEEMQSILEGALSQKFIF